MNWKRLALYVACLLIVILACRYDSPAEAPGEGEKAECGYQICDPVIEALEAYRQANGILPLFSGRFGPRTSAPLPHRSE